MKLILEILTLLDSLKTHLFKGILTPIIFFFFFFFVNIGREKVMFLYLENRYLLHCQDNENHGTGQIRPIQERNMFPDSAV